MQDIRNCNKSDAQILLVEDDSETATVISQILNDNNFQVIQVFNGEDALNQVTKKHPSMVLLDIKLPGISGFDVCSNLKNSKETQGIPVVIISSNDMEEDIVKGLNLGADDYVVKPFSPSVLVARIKSVLRRSEKTIEQDSLIQIDGLSLDRERFMAVADGEQLELGVSEFKILDNLMRSRGRVLTRDQIILAVHGANYPVTGRSIDVQIVSLRKKIGKYAKFIETVRGVGYRFTE